MDKVIKTNQLVFAIIYFLITTITIKNLNQPKNFQVIDDFDILIATQFFFLFLLLSIFAKNNLIKLVSNIIITFFNIIVLTLLLHTIRTV